MDLTRYTTAQLFIMHRSASDDARQAYRLAENKAVEMLELASSFDPDLYNVANAEFAMLMAQADDFRAYSRQVYEEIARRAQSPHVGGRTGNGTRYCRACGFTDCPGKDTGDCPRWPARQSGPYAYIREDKNLSGE